MTANLRIKQTKEQRERLRARRREGRAALRERHGKEAQLGCFLYLGVCDGVLSIRERSYLRREFACSQNALSPSRESLARNLRSFLGGCRPSLRERRELLAKLRDFAACDGPICSEEEAALQEIEELLCLSSKAREVKKRPWGGATKRPSVEQRTNTKEGAGSARRSRWKKSESAQVVQPQPQRSHWSYEYLGCTEDDTDHAIKRSYRRLAVKLHPDKHAARGLSPEEALSHLRAFQKLQQAYEEIWRLRGARGS